MKNYISALFLSVVLVGTAYAKLDVVEDINVVFSDGQTDTAQQMRGYILSGAQRYSDRLTNVLEVDDKNALRFTFNRSDQNFFTVSISYDATGFQVVFISSKNIRYQEKDGVKLIHENYKKWVNALVQEIREARKLTLNANGDPEDKTKATYIDFNGGAGYEIWYPDTEQVGRWKKDAAYLVPHGYFPALPMKVSGYYAFNGVTCGSLCIEFKPEGGRRYAVEWVQDHDIGKAGICSMAVFEVAAATPRKKVGAACY